MMINMSKIFLGTWETFFFFLHKTDKTVMAPQSQIRSEEADVSYQHVSPALS